MLKKNKVFNKSGYRNFLKVVNLKEVNDRHMNMEVHLGIELSIKIKMNIF